MEKFLENLQEAERILHNSDHLIYVSFPLIKDKNLLIKTILQTKKAVALCINAMLQYEYLYKRIKLYSDPKSNMSTFKEKVATRYSITPQEIQVIIDLFDLTEKHKKSSMEFVRKEKIVIISGEMELKSVDIQKTKEFLKIAQAVLEKIKTKILR